MKKNIIALVVVGLVSLIAISLAMRPTAPEEPIVNPPIEEEPEVPIVPGPIIRNIFNGVEINAEQNYQAFAIMIENTKDARPHSGISMADIVYEISVDGWAISRFMAIFGNEYPTKVGPVRSARVPFVEILKDWRLPFAHYGSAETGLGDALTLLKSINLPIRFDGNKGLNDEFYSRDSSRKAPHNAYFNAENALVKIPALTYEKRFTFDDVSTINDSVVNEFSLKYSSSNFINYIYDSSNNEYLRSINNEAMMDAYTSKQVAVKNIIILHAPHRAVEAVRYVLVDFVGEGKAEFFSNGKYEIGKWVKNSATSITQYFDSEGNEVVLQPGNTWIQVVHPSIEITVNIMD